VNDVCILIDVKKQTQMAMLSKERDRLMLAVRSYKSLFDTTNQLVAELRSMLLHVASRFVIIWHDGDGLVLATHSVLEEVVYDTSPHVPHVSVADEKRM